MNKTPFIALAAFALMPVAAVPQTAPDHPQFDAASIHVNRSADRASTRFDPARVELHKASIKHMVLRAFPLPDYQIVWPAWVGPPGALGYDVSVTFPPDTAPERLQLMFEDLLTTRFGLKYHWETRQLKAFEVTVSGRGANLHPAANPAPPTDFPKYSAHLKDSQWLLSSKLGNAPSGLTVSGFLEALDRTGILDRPLIDATGLKGYYDIDLTAPAELPDNKPDASELLNALDKQLGLKATLKTLPVRMLIIDHLNQIPTEN